MYKSNTISEYLDFSNGKPSGFDYLRILLAAGVIVMHSVITSYGQLSDYALWETPARPILRAIIPMFFALSGFLVAGSLFRCDTLIAFLLLRAIRIYPALIAEAILSAVLLGPIVTQLPWSSYFASNEFRLYLLNTIGDIHYHLPGVFIDNPLPRIVNIQLWTVPWELYCYACLAFIALLGVKRRPWIVPTIAALISLLHLCFKISRNGFSLQAFYVLGSFPQLLLVPCFLYGVTIFIYRQSIPISTLFIVLGLILSTILMYIPGGEYFCSPLIAYLTVCLGVLNPRKLLLIRSADYSYGIYLYGFVVQQTIVYALPLARHWFINIALALPISALLAWLSWHLIEKRALALKSLVFYLESRLIKGRNYKAPKNGS